MPTPGKTATAGEVTTFRIEPSSTATLTSTNPTSTAVIPATPPPTGTAAPSVTNSPASTVPQPPASPSPAGIPSQVPLKYPAPVLLEPRSGETRLEGKDDLVFRWKPLGALAADECYAVRVRVTNRASTVQRWAQDRFFAGETCGDRGESSYVEYVLPKRGALNYEGLVALATAADVPSSRYDVTWSVLVVKDLGQDPASPDKRLLAPLSPASDSWLIILFSP